MDKNKRRIKSLMATYNPIVVLRRLTIVSLSFPSKEIPKYVARRGM